MNSFSQSIVKFHSATSIQTVGIVGTGLMGRGIAIKHAQQGFPVLLHDVSEESLSYAVQKVCEEAFRAGHFSEDAVIATQKMEQLSHVDMVIESVVESMSIKRRILSRIEKTLHSEAILATNTSSIPITLLASRLERPENFCGVHFFHPVNQMQLVEVVRGEKTSQKTIDKVVAHVKSLGKIPVVVKDNPGFVVNRFLSLYLDSALVLLKEGANPLEIDQVAEEFGMPWGPLKLFDAIGIDTATRVGYVIQSAFPERLSPSELLYALYESDYLGQKNGKGFYSYDENGRQLLQIDPFVKDVIKKHIVNPCNHSTETIRERLFLPQVVEATRIVEEQLVQQAEEIETAIVNGLGFPKYRGGILTWGDTLGAKQIVQSLEKYASLGEQFKPTRTILECAITKTSLIVRSNQVLQPTLTKRLRKAG